MITNVEVFDNTHLPSRLLHREGELQALANALQDDTPGGDVLIAGPSGVGKTALARYGLQQASAETGLDYCLVECLGKTTGQILRRVLHQHPSGPSRVPHNTQLGDVTRGLQAHVEDAYVVILDEADDLPGGGVLDALADVPHVGVVVVCHDAERWLSQAGRHGERFRVEISPDRYGVGELVDILEPRARRGLEPGVVSRDQLEWIADESAGVARRGIQALRAAAELAAERGHREVRDEDVADCFERARSRIRESNLASLPYHHHVLYALVQDAGGELGARELHERYEDRADAWYQGEPAVPIGGRARRNKLAKLREYDLLEYEDAGSGGRYRVVDAGVSSRVAGSTRPP